jgi:hypothetical protein
MPDGYKPEAAWRYDNHLHRHNILIASDMNKCADRTLNARETLAFAQRVYDHEGAHSLFTARDNKKMTKLQEKAKIPFHLWNLMEDARIEAAWRKKFHRRFGWLRYMQLIDEEPKHPMLAALKAAGAPDPAIMLFLNCTRMENSGRLMDDWVTKDKDPKIKFEDKGEPKYGRRHLVRWYYRKAIRTWSTEGLVKLVASWLKTFPETGGGGAAGSGGCGAGGYAGPHGTDMGEGGEMPAGAQDADGSDHEVNAETTKPITKSAATKSGEPPKDAPRPELDPDSVIESKIVEIPKNHYFDSRAHRSIDFKRGDNLIRLFEKFLEGGEGIVTSRNPTNRIDFNKMLRGADDIYLRKGDDPLGVKKISFVFDASGSMTGIADQGCYLAYVLNELVRKRKIECRHMILSGGDFYKVPMPFDPKILNHLRTPGGTEGFANTMRKNEQELVDSDMTIFFTDGEITDEHISKEHWHRRGVYTIGLYVGQPEMSKKLHQWFDSVLVRTEIEHIADSLIQLIKRG